MKTKFLTGLVAVVGIAAAIFLIGYFARDKCDPRIARLIDPNLRLSFNEAEAMLIRTVAEVGPKRAVESALEIRKDPAQVYHGAIIKEAIRQWKPHGKTREELRAFLGAPFNQPEGEEKRQRQLPGVPNDFDVIDLYSYKRRPGDSGLSVLFWFKGGVIIHYVAGP